MGMYLNSRTEGFERALRSEIFVDKTEMIGYLNTVVGTNQSYVSVSRPRRFGKTMATNMIAAYYGHEADSRKLFEPLKLAKNVDGWDRYLNKFDVVSIVTTDFFGDSDNVDDFLDYMTDEVTTELMEAYHDIRYDKRINLRTVIDKIYNQTGHQFVIIVDEWDAIFRIWKNDNEGQVKYLDFLRSWLKDKPYVALAYITGILPIKKYGEHSALNMFDEYSMIALMQLAQYTGFTDDEVRELCDKYGRNYDEIKDWYDGYIVSDINPPDPNYFDQERGLSLNAKKYSIYSSLSVVKALRNGVVANYWNSTESYVALADYICMDFDGLKDVVALLMDGGRVKINISTYQNDMTTFSSRDDVLTLLIHLGYLGYDEDTGEVFIPNKEILQVFRDSTKTDDWTPVFDVFSKCRYGIYPSTEVRL